MTFTITKTKMAVALVAVVMVAATAAFAGAHPFNDVPAVGDPDERFYSEPVQWLWDNSLTTGSPSGSDTFKPLDNVTRGENATFNYRYDANVVQPALSDLSDDTETNADDIAANSAAIAGNDTDIAGIPTIHWARIDSDATIEATGSGVTATHQATGLFDVTFPQDVGDCAIHVTLSARNTTANLNIIALGYKSEPYAVVTDSSEGGANDGTVRVETRIHSSASAGADAVTTNLPFAIMATC